MKVERRILSACALVLATATSYPALGQEEKAWFGLPLPGPATDQVVNFSELDVPFVAAGDVTDAPELAGEELLKQVQALVDISYESRAAGDRLWGRLAGGPWAEKTVDYVANEFRKAGLVEVVKADAPYSIPELIPTEWKVAVVGAEAFGAGSRDIELASAVPMGARSSATMQDAKSSSFATTPQTRSVVAPVVYLGADTAADRAGVDVRGKVVILRVEPSVVLFNSPAPSQVGELIAAGAVGAIVIYNTPGNLQVQFGSCATAPCFTVGGEDGGFLNAAIAKASEAGVLDQVRVSMTATFEPRFGPGHLVFGKIRGQSSSGNLILSAHSDAWFAGANDNATGVATLIGLARHYAKGPPPAHDMYFVLSPGHHSPTGGLHRFAELKPQLASQNVFTINLEHVAQQGMTRDYTNDTTMGMYVSKYGERYAGWIPVNAESQGRQFSGSPLTPTVRRVVGDAARRTQFIAPTRMFEAHNAEMEPIGEGGGSTFQTVDAPLWYHTSGDTVATIPPEALQRSALFFKDILDQMQRLSRAEVRAGAKPAPE
jgi:hypothetical protein